MAVEAGESKTGGDRREGGKSDAATDVRTYRRRGSRRSPKSLFPQWCHAYVVPPALRLRLSTKPQLERGFPRSAGRSDEGRPGRDRE